MGLFTAIGLFTTLPSPPRDVDRAAAGRALRVFPLVGLVIGVLAGAVGYAGFWFGRPLIGVVAALIVLAWTTGAMHLDGLADTADGLGSRQPPEKALTIMRASDVGPMGVAALVLVLLLQAAALVSLGSPLQLLIAVVGGAVISRVVCVIATTRLFPSARTSGFGALFHDTVSPVGAILTGVLSGVGVVVVGTLVLMDSYRLPHEGFPTLNLFVGMAAAVLVAFVIGLWAAQRFARRLGGLTGDTFGAVIEVSATAFWLALAFAI